ncbi:hypothetical protein [Ramlibacter sp. Leaf400]|uniref:hypothetical protein n=1 Tax=Ramlibacter sp. Leaf400 TaxID=1736365 RepID=UPI0006FF845C|nr:hypothetical protein [Ramlibacter sp. Leaf400]KQT09337.1 hypothetical protein ASG30_12220 [Ramlibacter sp. Leaf400]
MSGAGAASPSGGTGTGAAGGTGTSAGSSAGTAVSSRRTDSNAPLRARVAVDGAVSSPVTATMGGPPQVMNLPPLER